LSLLLKTLWPTDAAAQLLPLFPAIVCVLVWVLKILSTHARGKIHRTVLHTYQVDTAGHQSPSDAAHRAPLFLEARAEPWLARASQAQPARRALRSVAHISTARLPTDEKRIG
jgi:hypothetical protein